MPSFFQCQVNELLGQSEHHLLLPFSKYKNTENSKYQSKAHEQIILATVYGPHPHEKGFWQTAEIGQRFYLISETL